MSQSGASPSIAVAIERRIETWSQTHAGIGSCWFWENQLAERVGCNSITGHGTFLNDAGRKLLADSNTIVAHQAQSNMDNAVGRADVFALLESGVDVVIGTDGMTPDLRREVMTGYLMHKHHVGDNNLGWTEYEQMVMKNNPAIYQRLTGQKVGCIESGYLADIILVDYYPPTAFNGNNFWGHFLFGLVDANVSTTIINGKVVMHDKNVLGIDERDIAIRSQKVAERVWQRYSEAGGYKNNRC